MVNVAGHRGRFITLEGIEGAGKTTQATALVEALARQGIDALATREPGGTAQAEAIRSLLVDPAARGIVPDAELLLVFAARAEHIAKVIRPALAAGKWVVSDRFTDATFAYQGGGRGIEAGRIAMLEQWVQGGLRPDLTLVLDLPVPAGRRRIRERRADRFEQEDNAFLERVRRAYLERARADPARCRIIDASRSPPETAASIRRVVLEGHG